MAKKSPVSLTGKSLKLTGFLDIENGTIEAENFVNPVNIMDVAEKVGLHGKFCYITIKETDLEISEDELEKAKAEEESEDEE